MSTRISIAALALGALVGCAEEPDVDGLDIAYSSESVSGTLQVENDIIGFRADMTSETSADVVIDLNGMSLVTALSRVDGSISAEMDGFTTEGGLETQMMEQDRQLVIALARALEEAAPADAPPVSKFLLASALMWTKTSSTMPLQRSVRSDDTRSVDKICGYLNGWGVPASHDCCYNWEWHWYGGHWHNCPGWWQEWQYVDIGPAGSVCYPDANGCGGGYNGNWQWGDNYGECTPGFSTGLYTYDCLYHDHCVRNHGHGLASGFCDDQAASASDDVASAAWQQC